MSATQRPRAATPGASHEGHSPILRAEGTDRAELLAQFSEERARFRRLTDTVRQILQGQPSPHLVHTTARRITATIHQIADDIAGRQS